MKEYTIKQAAEIMEVSKSTVRRRINNGELKAEKKQGPYGQQYYIPESELDQAVIDKEIMEVREVNQPIDKEQFINELSEALTDNIKGNIDRAEDTLQETIEGQNEQLQQDIQELRKEVEGLKEQQQNKGLWSKFKNIFK